MLVSCLDAPVYGEMYPRSRLCKDPRKDVFTDKPRPWKTPAATTETDSSGAPFLLPKLVSEVWVYGPPNGLDFRAQKMRPPSSRARASVLRKRRPPAPRHCASCLRAFVNQGPVLGSWTLQTATATCQGSVIANSSISVDNLA